MNQLTIQPTAAVAHLRDGPYLRDGAATHRHMNDAADLIERQERQIEALTAALKQARTVIAVDRASFIQCATAPHQPLDADDQGIVDEFDGLLRMIEEALGGNDASE